MRHFKAENTRLLLKRIMKYFVMNCAILMTPFDPLIRFALRWPTGSEQLKMDHLR